jgi:hypothetical protein
MPCPAGKSWRVVAFVADHSARTPQGGGILSSGRQFGTLYARRALGACVRFIVNT